MRIVLTNFILPRATKPIGRSRDVVDFLHHENPPTWVGVEPATLGAEGKRQTNYATQLAAAVLKLWSVKISHLILRFPSFTDSECPHRDIEGCVILD
ncbi:hypothetical protein TNCV_4553281 [Trichonephila clavipes]|nr:hypothetical protein TNCV_4553281 [Trichonephila clavipes]